MDNNQVKNYLLERKGQKMPSISELASELNVEGKELVELIKIIDNMEVTGEVIITKKGRIALPEDMGFFSGKIQMHQKGFGFLIKESEKDKKSRNDIFIPPDSTMNAMNGDTVLVKLASHVRPDDARLEGEVVKIVKRNTTTVIGVYQESQNFGFVIPEDKKIREDVFIKKGDSLGAKNNDVVVVEISKYSSDSKSAEGKVISVLGRKGDPGIDMLTIITKYGLPQEFPEKVLEYVNKIPDVISDEELNRRRDLTNETIVTIDGADAKDLDDAVTVEKLPNGNYKLGVHIADVSNYVKEGSILDEEALKRATSVYLLDIVIPMLPQKLSNNLCSLNPGTIKLTLSCVMEIDTFGKVKEYDIFESFIKTSARMTYDDVTAILRDKDEVLMEKYKELVPLFKDMEELYEILRKKREVRGAIDFDFTESYIEVNEEGFPIDVRPHERAVSNRIIEEFMLAANECVAESYSWQKIPFVYRIHEDPDPEKLEIFSHMATNMGYPIRMGKGIEPRHLQEILNKVKGTESEQVLSKLLLRSMMQARYSPINLGHFGLAAEYYSHFTSPIRRYPDLQIHRIIKKHLKGELTGQELERYQGQVEKASLISSDMERIAQDAEREVDDMKKAQYMHSKLGEEFDGIISSITGFGFFVELPNTVEGLVHTTEMPGSYTFDEDRMIHHSDTGGNDFRLGNKVRVKVASVDVDNRQINFAFLGRLDEEGTVYDAYDKTKSEPLILGDFSRERKGRRNPKSHSNSEERGFSKGKSKSGKGFSKSKSSGSKFKSKSGAKSKKKFSREGR